VELVRPAAPDPEVVEKAVRRQFSASYKLGVLREADGCREPGEIGALLRREGLYSSHLAAWRRQRAAGELASLSPHKRGRKAKKRNPLQRRLAQLERDKARLTQRLQQAELIIEFQKKVSEILGIPLGSKETSEDESSTLVQRLLSGQRAVLHARSPRCPLSASMRNHQLESRMREIRLSGSEGGGGGE